MILCWSNEFLLVILSTDRFWKVCSSKAPQTCLAPFNLGQLLDKKLFICPAIPRLGSSMFQFSLAKSHKLQCHSLVWKQHIGLQAQCYMNLLSLFLEFHWRSLQGNGVYRYSCYIFWSAVQFRPFSYGKLGRFLHYLGCHLVGEHHHFLTVWQLCDAVLPVHEEVREFCKRGKQSLKTRVVSLRFQLSIYLGAQVLGQSAFEV